MHATLHSAGERFELRFERWLPHPPEKVWRALTELSELTHWFPADPHIDDLAVGRTIRFVFRTNEGPTLDGEIRPATVPAGISAWICSSYGWPAARACRASRRSSGWSKSARST